MSPSHASACVFCGEYVTTTSKPASSILLVMEAPRPPIPPVTNASRFAMRLSFTGHVPFEVQAGFCQIPAAAAQEKSARRDLERENGGAGLLGAGPLFDC